jgi:peptidyl-prolyl cis-trans isomerase C
MPCFQEPIVHRVIPILLLAVVAGCSKGTPAAQEGTAAAALQTPPPAAAQFPAGGPATAPTVKAVPPEIPAVVARVNGEDISKTDFESAVRNLEARANSPVPPTERDRVFRNVLDELIGYKLLLQESRARKVTVSEADVDTRMAAVQKQFPSENDFKKMLEARQITVQKVRAELKNEIVVGRLLESEVASKIGVTNEDVATFYKRESKSFQLPEKVRASHILIGVPAGADATAKAAAMTTATTVLKKARGGGDFAALAREYSQDPGSAASGGDLGFFEQGKMLGAFNDAAFKLGKGEISDIVETEYGYHIIQVTDKQAARVVPLDEARPQIENHLKNVNRQKQTQEFVRALRSKAKVEVLL